MPTRKKFRRNNRNKKKSRRKRQRGGEKFCKEKTCPCPRTGKNNKMTTNNECKKARTYSDGDYLKNIDEWFKKEIKNEKKDNTFKEENFPYKAWFYQHTAAKNIHKEIKDANTALSLLQNSKYVKDNQDINIGNFITIDKTGVLNWQSKINPMKDSLAKLENFTDLQLKNSPDIQKKNHHTIKSAVSKTANNQLEFKNLNEKDPEFIKTKENH